MDVGRIEVECEAAPDVQRALHALGRTEDIRFSPSNRRIAIAAFARRVIAIVDFETTAERGRAPWRLVDVREVTAPEITGPHGVDFLDEETLIIANRTGGIVLIRIPAPGDGRGPRTIAVLADRSIAPLDSPGSVRVVSTDDGSDVLVGNNLGNTVSRHRVAESGTALLPGSVVAERLLTVPDGIAVSPSGWLAVSNHHTHTVFLYRALYRMDDNRDPDGILRGVAFPHGVRFTADGRRFFVADAGSPYIHVFTSDDGGEWPGVRFPAASIRVMDDEVFQRGRRTPQEGGPKGLDLDLEGHVLAITSEFQPLTFFNVAELVERATTGCRDDALMLTYELDVLEQARLADLRLHAFERSTSFRLTKPFRVVHSLWRRPIS
jgi:sugar lactone lactonase YvrE